MKKLLRAKRGEGYVDMCVGVVVFVMILVKETSSGTIVIDEPEKDTQSDETKNINEDDKLADDGKGRLSPEVETDDISKSGSTGEKAKDTNKTVTEQPRGIYSMCKLFWEMYKFF